MSSKSPLINWRIHQRPSEGSPHVTLIEESASGDSDGAREPPRDLVEEFGKAAEDTGKNC